MSFEILQGDLTECEVDAIVNAANTQLQQGGGVCGQIFKKAGPKALKEACDPLAPIQTGEAVITPGFDLPAQYIIHTAGPVYKDGKSGEEEDLANAYRNSLELALENGCQSIAFPLLSSGIYGYPKKEAFQVAKKTIEEFLEKEDMDIYLVIFDQESLEMLQE